MQKCFIICMSSIVKVLLRKMIPKYKTSTNMVKRSCMSSSCSRIVFSVISSKRTPFTVPFTTPDKTLFNCFPLKKYLSSFNKLPVLILIEVCNQFEYKVYLHVAVRVNMSPHLNVLPNLESTRSQTLRHTMYIHCLSRFYLS